MDGKGIEKEEWKRRVDRGYGMRGKGNF